MLKVIVQKWEESELGWGLRPDGYSLHFTEADRQEYLDSHWDRMPKSTPNEYSRPVGEPFKAEVDEETFLRVVRSKNGIRKWPGVKA